MGLDGRKNKTKVEARWKLSALFAAGQHPRPSVFATCIDTPSTADPPALALELGAGLKLPSMLFTWMQPAQFSSTLGLEEWLEAVTIHHWLTSFPPTEPIMGHGFSRTPYVCSLLGSTTLQNIHQFIYVSCVIILFIREPASSRSYPLMSLMKSLLFFNISPNYYSASLLASCIFSQQSLLIQPCFPLHARSSSPSLGQMFPSYLIYHKYASKT